MKRVSVVLVSSSVVVLVLLTAVLGWYGYFSSVTVQKKPIGPFLIVYQKHVGTADKSVVINEIKQFLAGGWPAADVSTFGLYYDDPKVTPAKRCRSIVGCVIEYDGKVDLHAISEQYSIATIPRGMAVVCDYPLKNKISILFGLLKGYSALLEYADRNDISQRPVLELNDPSRGRIRYAMFTAFEPAFFDAYLMLE